jgi:hypothetical protein
MKKCRIFFLSAAGCAAVFGLLAVQGCSPSGSRQALEGTVTVDGTPLPEGSIAFIPKGETKSPTCGGTISEGRFSILPTQGAGCGTFRVEITAIRSSGKKIRHPQSGNMMDEFVQYIPARYNEKSELTATVGSSGANSFDFSLKSK